MTLHLPTSHFSVSQAAMYLRCGEQYRRRYCEGERVPPGIALVKGTAVHGAAESNHKQKISTRQDLPLADIKDAAATTYKARIATEGLYLVGEERTRKDKVIGEGLDDSVSLAEVYGKSIAPSIQPVAVELQAKVALGGDFPPMIGYLDVVDEEQRIRDLKTSSKKKPGAAIQSLQLTTYAMFYYVLQGRMPEAVVMDVAIRSEKGDTSAQKLVGSRQVEDFDPLLAGFGVIMRAISAGVFPPADPEAWVCNPRWCGYWWDCPFISPSTRRAVTDSL